MIITFLINALLLIVAALWSFLPVVHISDLPYFGQQISNVLVLISGYWNAFFETFPYATVGWHAFIYIIIPFELGMLVVKFLLGSRAPAHTNN